MEDYKEYDEFKNIYGKNSSLTVWQIPAENRIKSKDSISVINDVGGHPIDFLMQEHFNNKDIKYIFVGLNPAKQSCDDCKTRVKGKCKGKTNNSNDDWSSFHSICTIKSQDYKLRYALLETPYWDSFITDLFYEPTRNSSELIPTQKQIEDGIMRIKKARTALGPNAEIIAIGKAVYSYLYDGLGKDIVLKEIPHFSNSIDIDWYRIMVLTQLGDYGVYDLKEDRRVK